MVEEPPTYFRTLSDNASRVKLPSVSRPDHRLKSAEPVGLELEEATVGDTSGLDTDVHVIPIERLVERLNTNLTTGLTDNMVAQHRVTYGPNKLTPARPPSFLCMFLKQLIIGFNSVLWLATLFAFLSYVSSSTLIDRC